MGKTANQTSQHVGFDLNESETMRERLLNGDAKVPEEILSDRDLNLQCNAEHNSGRKKKRTKKQRSTQSPLQNNVIDHDLQEVTSMTPSIQEGNMCKLDCSLKTVQETTKFEGSDTRLRKKRRKNRKRKQNVLNYNDTHHDHVEGSLMKNTSLEQDSFQPLLVEKHLEADSDTTQYCAKVNLFLDTNREQEQSKRHDPSESNNSSSKTDDKYSVKVDGNPVSAVAEPDCSHERCLDSISTRKHDDFVEANVVSPETGNIKTYKRKKRVKTYRRKKGKASKSLGNSLEFSEEGAGSPELVVQDKMEDTSLDHLNEVVVSGNSISMSEIDAVVCQTTQMKQLSQVVEDLSINKESDGCSDGKPVSKESKKGIATETLNLTTNEGSIEINDSVVEIVVEHLEQANRGKIDVIQNAVQDASVAEENFSESTSFKDDNSVIGVSGTDLSSNLLVKKILEGKSEMEEPISSSSQLSAMKDDVSLAISKEEHSLQVVQSSPERALMVPFPKKLLILDVNGLLADIVLHISDRYRADTIIGNKAVFKRPFCDDFLQFCFERFNVGVWSSRTRRNVQLVLDFLMGENQKNLLFCWDQSHCTDTGYNTVENRDKPLLLKELKKLWEKNEQNLPWERGEYNESNTLLLDDSPYKALCNPPNTAIFPHTYWYKDVKDNSLGPGGDLRVYLEKLAIAENVQKYVEQNPFGQRPITERNLSWAFYLKVISTVSSHYESKET